MSLMISQKEEARRISEYEARFELIEPAVDELIDLRKGVGANEDTPGYINHGRAVAVFRIKLGDLDLAIRLPKQISDYRGYDSSFVGGRAMSMARAYKAPCAEQGFAISSERGITASHYVNGEPHDKRGLRGGLWLLAHDVERLMDAQEELAALNVTRDAGRMDNLLVGPAGLTCVDMLAGPPDPMVMEHTVTELLYSFRPRALGRMAAVPKEQVVELEKIAVIFEQRYPDSCYMPFVTRAAQTIPESTE